MFLYVRAASSAYSSQYLGTHGNFYDMSTITVLTFGGIVRWNTNIVCQPVHLNKRFAINRRVAPCNDETKESIDSNIQGTLGRASG